MVSEEVDAVVQKVVDAKPDVILNTINGDSNLAFFQALRAAGVRSQQIPTLSFSVAEVELQDMRLEDMVGDYAAWNYFQSLDTSTNQDFVERFQARYGDDRVTDDPIEAAYLAVNLWADTVEKAGTVDVGPVREQLGDARYQAPQGWIRVDPDNQHLWKTVRLGQVNRDGQFDIVWESNVDIRPEPFPDTRTEAGWQAFLDDLFDEWNGRWVNPGDTSQKKYDATMIKTGVLVQQTIRGLK